MCSHRCRHYTHEWSHDGGAGIIRPRKDWGKEGGGWKGGAVLIIGKIIFDKTHTC